MRRSSFRKSEACQVGRTQLPRSAAMPLAELQAWECNDCFAFSCDAAFTSRSSAADYNIE